LLGVSWSSRFSLWYAASAKPMSIVLVLATGGMPVISIGLTIGEMPMSSVSLAIGEMHVSVGQFVYSCDACELVALSYSWVT
jgi:hypothetical protein